MDRSRQPVKILLPLFVARARDSALALGQLHTNYIACHQYNTYHTFDNHLFTPKQPVSNSKATIATSKVAANINQKHFQSIRRNLSNTIKARQLVHYNNMVSSKVPPPIEKGTICVEGNIGCGKTTFLEFFRNNIRSAGDSDQDIIAEPVEKWRNVEGENLFQYLYKDPARYSLAFQTYVQLTMMKLHMKRPRMMERSIYSARYCFVENLYQLNYLSRLEYVILDKWFKHLVLAGNDDFDFNETGTSSCEELEYTKLSNPTGIPTDLIVSLRCAPQKVMDRIRVRSRTEEKDISLNYIQSLHDLHEDWLVSRKFPVPAPVLILDTNCRQSSLVKLYEQAAPYICGEKKLTKSSTIISLENEALLVGY